MFCDDLDYWTHHNQSLCRYRWTANGGETASYPVVVV